MDIYRWNPDKNELLKKERGVCFEDIIQAINEGCLLEVQANPNPKYPLQGVLIVSYKNYPYVIPFVLEGKSIFLKTIIPNRKLKKRYGGQR